MHPLIVRYVVYPVHNFVQVLKGYKTVKYEKELMESQWFTPAQIEEIQQEKLRVLIEHAYKNVPFYTRLFDELKLKPSDIKDIEDMNKLPLLSMYFAIKYRDEGYPLMNFGLYFIISSTSSPIFLPVS